MSQNLVNSQSDADRQHCLAIHIGCMSNRLCTDIIIASTAHTQHVACRKPVDLELTSGYHVSTHLNSRVECSQFFFLSSGGGMGGLVFALALKKYAPDIRFDIYESV